jgi:RND family efflux transporter MFP subunit
VTVQRPVVRDVVEWDEYTARLEAVDAVEVRARVSGYLEAVRFNDGAMVHKGDVLFIIDQRPYVAILNRTEAEIALAKARLELANKRYERAARLVARNAISQEETDTRAAEARQATASLQAAKAAYEAAHLDVEFTEVRAPVSGRIGRKLVTEGNLVTGGAGTQATLLTTIVSLDPIYVYFEADERAYLKYTRLAREGLRPSSRDVQNPVDVGFADEDGFPHRGHMDFVDNRFDPNTGTMIGRAVLPNPDLAFAPGLFARLRLVGSGQYRATLIPDTAINSDQAQKFVYVLGTDDTAQYRTIIIGPLNEGLRIVRSGLTPEDRVVVTGVQRLRPGAKVIPEEKAPSGSPVPGAGDGKAGEAAPAGSGPANAEWKPNQ